MTTLRMYEWGFEVIDHRGVVSMECSHAIYKSTFVTYRKRQRGFTVYIDGTFTLYMINSIVWNGVPDNCPRLEPANQAKHGKVSQ